MDEIARLRGHGFSPRDTRIRRPGGDGDGNHRVLDSRTQHRHQGERQHQSWKGHEDVGHAHQHQIGPAAKVAGAYAYHQPERCRQHRHQGDDHQGRARAVDGAAQQVAPELIGTEQVVYVGRHQPVGYVLCVRVERRQPGRQQRRRHHRCQNQQTEQHCRTAQRTQPDAKPAAAAGLPGRGRRFAQQPVGGDHRIRGSNR